MNTFDEVIEMIKNLSPFELLVLSQNLKEIINSFNLSNFVESNRFSEGFICPRCKSKNIIRNGKKNGKQRYFCKECNHNFMDTTTSIAYKSKFSIAVWSKYIDCMLLGMSLRETAKRCGIHFKTAFYWRHKILKSLQVYLKTAELSGIIEADETFVLKSYKGNHKKSKTFVMPRPSKKRGTPAKKRGLSGEQVCVSCMIDRNGNISSKIAGSGRITTNQLYGVVEGISITPGSTLVTDKASAYVKFAEAYKLDLVSLKSGFEYVRGIYHIQHVNAFHSKLKQFLRGFNGIATKHLPSYLNWFVWLYKHSEMNAVSMNQKTLGKSVGSVFKCYYEDIDNMAA